MTDEWLFDGPNDTQSNVESDDEQGFEILDRNRDRDSGKLLAFLVMEDGETKMKKATPENVLLYEHGLKQFLTGNHAVIVSGSNPEVIIAPTGNNQAYLLRVNGSTVETTPAQATNLLSALRDAVEAQNSAERDNAISEMVGVYDDIISSQVRRWLVRALKTTFDRTERQRIDEVDRGWLIDDFYLVDWNANLYTAEDDPEEDDYSVSSGQARAVDRSYEFLRLSPRNSPEPMDVTINDDEYRVSEREMLFLSKVRFMLDRRYYHPDKPFWEYTDNLADIDDVDTSGDDDGGFGGLNL